MTRLVQLLLLPLTTYMVSTLISLSTNCVWILWKTILPSPSSSVGSPSTWLGMQLERTGSAFIPLAAAGKIPFIFCSFLRTAAAGKKLLEVFVAFYHVSQLKWIQVRHLLHISRRKILLPQIILYLEAQKEINLIQMFNFSRKCWILSCSDL